MHARASKDAEVLSHAGRYDGAIYLCGYAVEMALKARICRTLGWLGYPATSGEFQYYRSFQTHNLDVLLHLTGIEERMKRQWLAEWSAVATWDPEVRYKPIGNATQQDAARMIDAAERLMRVL